MSEERCGNEIVTEANSTGTYTRRCGKPASHIKSSKPKVRRHAAQLKSGKAMYWEDPEGRYAGQWTPKKPPRVMPDEPLEVCIENGATLKEVLKAVSKSGYKPSEITVWGDSESDQLWLETKKPPIGLPQLRRPPLPRVENDPPGTDETFDALIESGKTVYDLHAEELIVQISSNRSGEIAVTPVDPDEDSVWAAPTYHGFCRQCGLFCTNPDHDPPKEDQ